MPEEVYLKVLELFSGVGGMHTALNVSGLPGEICAAIDINSVANDVYCHNFPSVKVMRRNIQKVTAAFVNKLGVNTILMSPPCQPFTRVGNRKDMADTRSVPLKHILSILPDLVRLEYLLVENVTGFEKSEAGEQLRAAVTAAGFNFRELMITPLQLGIPNSRERYYMIAVKNPLDFIVNIPPRDELTDDSIRNLLTNFALHRTPRCVGDVLEFADDAPSYDDYLVPDNVLRKRAWILDISNKTSVKSLCFTKSYTHYVEGTGSVYCPFDDETVRQTYDRAFTFDPESAEYIADLKTLKLRFFTPKEVQRLLCFPDGFSFPESVSRKQKYRLLGNSINIDVVSRLIKIMGLSDQLDNR